ncbi:hypothetical protein VTI28DRAFT_7858 [Corynascus sepedonium]
MEADDPMSHQQRASQVYGHLVRRRTITQEPVAWEQSRQGTDAQRLGLFDELNGRKNGLRVDESSSGMPDLVHVAQDDLATPD